MRPYLLALAAVPALLGSLWLLNRSDAPHSLLLQQAAVATVALLATLIAVRFTKPTYSAAPSPVPLLLLAAVLFVPLLAQTSDGPHRWLRIVGLRLYLAPVVLPLFLVLWQRVLTNKLSFWASSISACLVAIALFAQPDAAQLTAFSAAAVSILCCSDTSKERKVSAIAIAVVAAAASWRHPDPLQPVPYVEGVFLLAAGTSYFALAAVVAAAALPVVVLVWLGSRHRAVGALAVALYFSVLLLLAPTLTTPVPLLGFGAGPILGYFLVAGQAWRRRGSAA